MAKLIPRSEYPRRKEDAQRLYRTRQREAACLLGAFILQVVGVLLIVAAIAVAAVRCAPPH